METDKLEGVETVTQPQPTAEQQLETLRSEFKAKEAELQKAKSTEQGLRGSLKEKDKILNEQQGIMSRLDAFEQTQKILAAMIAEKGEVTDGDPSQKQDYLKKFEDIQKNVETKRTQDAEKAKRDAQIAEWQTKADETKVRTESLGLTDEDEAYHEIRHLVTEGDFKLADIKLKKLESQKKAEKKAEKPNETDDQRIERLADEKSKAYLQSKGAWKADTGVPSGSGKGKLTAEMVANMTPDERFARRREIDTMPFEVK